MQLVNKNKKKKKEERKGKKGKKKEKEDEEHGDPGPRESLNARKTPSPIYIVHLDNTFFTVSKRGVVWKRSLWSQEVKGGAPGFWLISFELNLVYTSFYRSTKIWDSIRNLGFQHPAVNDSAVTTIKSSDVNSERE